MHHLSDIVKHTCCGYSKKHLNEMVKHMLWVLKRKHFLGAQRNYLIEMVPLSTENMFYLMGKKKITILCSNFFLLDSTIGMFFIISKGLDIHKF